MHVYKIQYQSWEYNCMGRGDHYLSPDQPGKYVMAADALKATDTLRSRTRGRIEISSVEFICTVDEMAGS